MNHYEENSKSNVKRQCITARYGGEGKHSNTYMDYVINKRKEMNKYLNSKKKEQFYDHIKKNKIYLPLPEDKEGIEGAFIK